MEFIRFIHVGSSYNPVLDTSYGSGIQAGLREPEKTAGIL